MSWRTTVPERRPHRPARSRDGFGTVDRRVWARSPPQSGPKPVCRLQGTGSGYGSGTTSERLATVGGVVSGMDETAALPSPVVSTEATTEPDPSVWRTQTPAPSKGTTTVASGGTRTSLVVDAAALPWVT